MTTNADYLNRVNEQISKAKAERNKFSQMAETRQLTNDEKVELASLKEDLQGLSNRRDNLLIDIEREHQVREAESRMGLPEHPTNQMFESSVFSNTRGSGNTIENAHDLVDLIEGRSAGALLERLSLIHISEPTRPY